MKSRLAFACIFFPLLAGCGGSGGSGDNSQCATGPAPIGATRPNVFFFPTHPDSTHKHAISPFIPGSDGTLVQSAASLQFSTQNPPQVLLANAGAFAFIETTDVVQSGNGQSTVTNVFTPYAIGADGGLTPSGTPLSITGSGITGQSLFLHPSGGFGYLTPALPENGTLTFAPYIVEADGTLATSCAPNLVVPVPNGTGEGLVFQPNGKFAYATSTSADLTTVTYTPYAVGANGLLSASGKAVGVATTQTQVSDGENFIFSGISSVNATSNSSTDTFTSYAIGSDGTLAASGTPITINLPGGPTSYALLLYPDATGRFVYIDTLDYNSDQETYTPYTIGADGSLRQTGTTLSDAGLNRIFFEATGKFAYIQKNNTPTSSSITYTPYAIGADGSLTPTGTPLVLAE